MGGWLGSRIATVVDLFAGTGGMGLASLIAPPLENRAKIVFTGEIDPNYIALIKQNYDFFGREIGRRNQLPPQLLPKDVGARETLRELDSISRQYGGVSLLLAGPPCQGFSKSNVRSRDRQNPLNLLALDAVDCIRVAAPQIAVIENVPGIRTMPSARSKRLTVTEQIECELRDFGYHVETHLLNAADYGVPQYRIRAFTIAISKHILPALGLKSLIPQPRYGLGKAHPYRTVADALSDLPPVANGTKSVLTAYASPPQCSYQREIRRHSLAVYDHVTSNHSPYVIDRFASIPQGENWRVIRNKLRNYSDPDNTHNNIYKRLDERLPAGTIGNFRKAMTIHPRQDRGLSLREAARLQSLPDWLRFFPDDPEVYRRQLRGLSWRQQQIGNAVCFRLTQKLIAHLFSNA